ELQFHCDCGKDYFVKDRHVVVYKTSKDSHEYPYVRLTGSYFGKVNIRCECGEPYVVHFED
ncbi:hypothetical protein MKX03_031748, partial [Papaver bracteatum]